MIPTDSAHVDRFVIERMPPPECWPVLCGAEHLPPYPSRLNAASVLLDSPIAVARGARPCLIGRDETWTYRRVGDTVAQIATWLAESAGIVPGNRVLVRGPNSPMMAAAWLAVVRAGGVIVPVQHLLRRVELAKVLDKTRPSLILCDAAHTGDLASFDTLPGPVVPFNTEAANGLDRQIAGIVRCAEAVDTDADDPALIAFSSGTNGLPRAAVHRHRDLVAVTDLAPRLVLRTTQSDVFCGSPSLAFAYGIGGQLLFPLRVGASVVYVGHPTPGTLIDVVARNKATLLFAVPTLYRGMAALFAAGGARAEALASLRGCITAGEPLTVVDCERWRAATGHALLDSFGATEMLNAVVHTPPGGARPGILGFPVPGYTVRVVDEALRTLPSGVPGQLAVRGPTGCRYLDDDRQADFVRDGWNLTGDIASIDPDGALHYVSRTDDLIVSAGLKIAGPEVEEELRRHPAVADCFVTGFPDATRSSVPAAYVAVRSGFAADAALARDLRDWTLARLAPHKAPRIVIFREHLPRLANGKVDRVALVADQPADSAASRHRPTRT